MEPLKYIKTETLPKKNLQQKGLRIRTSLHLVLVDPDIFVTLVTGFIRGEITHLETRVGVTVKHPLDKYDRPTALAEAAKRLGKRRHSIVGINVTRDTMGEPLTKIILEASSPLSHISLEKGKVRIWPRK